MESNLEIAYHDTGAIIVENEEGKPQKIRHEINVSLSYSSQGDQRNYVFKQKRYFDEKGNFCYDSGIKCRWNSIKEKKTVLLGIDAKVFDYLQNNLPKEVSEVIPKILRTENN